MSDILAGLIPEIEYCRQRGVSQRTAARERATRSGPPFVKVGRQIFYRTEAVREWLHRHEHGGDGSRSSGRTAKAGKAKNAA